eukprot:SAG25_NODE_459_length_7828_cov_24.263907_7_plen_63_part_00
MDDLVVTVRYIPTNFDSQNVRRIFLGGLNNPRLPSRLSRVVLRCCWLCTLCRTCPGRCPCGP